MSDFLTGIGWTTGVLGLLTLMVLGAVNYSGQGATFRERILSSPTLSPLLIIHYFLPYGLVVLVLFMDLMSQLPQGVFGLATGIIAIAINRFVGGAPDFPNDLCEIPGLKGLASKFVPQSLLFVSTVVTYLAAFVTTSVSQPLYSSTLPVSSSTPSTSTRIGASWGLAISVILIQLFSILSTPGCVVDPIEVSFVGITLPATLRPILAVLFGMAAGGGAGYGFATMKITQPSYNALNPYASTPPVPATKTVSSGFVREQFQLGAGLGEMPMPSQGGDIPIDIAKSSGAVTPGESSDQFVCEAYKNGQLVTSTLIG